VIKRLEQVVALVVAAGLAIVSYWLFFSWAGGGDRRRPAQPHSRSQGPAPLVAASEATAGFQHPLLGGAVIEAGEVSPHLLATHRQTE
jgi:hypothetical protein